MQLVQIFPRESQEMVFEAHQRAFRFFGGVCRRGIYDNMKTAVSTVFVGKKRLSISGRSCGQDRLRRSSSASATRGIAHSNCCGLPRSKHPISPGFLSRRGRHYDRPHDGAAAHRVRF